MKKSVLLILGLFAAACSDTVVEPLDRSPTSPPVAMNLTDGVAGDDYVLAVGRDELPLIAAAITDAGGSIVRSHPEAGVLIVGDLSEDAAATISELDGVQAMALDVMIEEPSEPGSLETLPESHDPKQAFFYQLGFQWDMEIIHADDAWDAGASGEGVTVAILDTGIDATHTDLLGLVDASRSIAFVPNANPSIPAWGDDKYHGTHVAGTVASNGFGTAGVAPHATLMSVKVCGAFFGCPYSAIISGIIFAAENDADVINMSLGGFIGRRFPGAGQLNAILSRVMNYANRKGVVVVSAAGNAGVDLDHLGRDFRAGSFIATPCESGNGMCVSATNYLDQPTEYTNYGTSAISLAAPGGDNGVPRLVLAPCSTQSVYLPVVAGFSCGSATYLWLSGTSMASPHVAGAAALVRAQGIRNPGAIKTTLERSADDLGDRGADPYYGKGRLNVASAVGAN